MGNSSDHVFTQYMLGEIPAAGTILSISQRHLGVLTPTKYKHRHWNNWFFPLFSDDLFLDWWLWPFCSVQGIPTAAVLHLSRTFFISAGHSSCHESSPLSSRRDGSFIHTTACPAAVAAGIFQWWVAVTQKWPGEFPKIFSSPKPRLMPPGPSGDVPYVTGGGDGRI